MSKQIQVIIKGDQTLQLNLNFFLQKDQLSLSTILKMIKDKTPEYDAIIKNSYVIMSQHKRKKAIGDQDKDTWLCDGEDIKTIDIDQLEIVVTATPKAKETSSSKFEPFLNEASILSAEASKIYNNQANLSDTLTQAYKFSSVAIGKHAKQKFLVAKSGNSDTVYLAIPGEDGFEDIQAAFKFPHSNDCFAGCRLHSGFYTKAKSIPIIAIYKHYYNFFKERGKKFNFIVCGHSCGGAIAQIVTMMLLTYLNQTNAIDEEYADIFSITYGAPYWVNKNRLEEIKIGKGMRLLKDFLINIFIEDDVIVHILNFEIGSRLRASADQFKESLENIVTSVKGYAIGAITKFFAKILSAIIEGISNLGIDKLVFAIAKEMASYVPTGKYYSFIDNHLKEFSPMELKKSIETVSRHSIGDFQAIHGIENYRFKVQQLGYPMATSNVGYIKEKLDPNEKIGVDANICLYNECLVELYNVEEKNQKRIMVLFDSCTPSIVQVKVKCNLIKGLEEWKILEPCGCYHEYPIDNNSKYRVAFQGVFDDTSVDYANSKCYVEITSPFKQIQKEPNFHVAQLSDKHKFSIRQIQTAWFMLMTCSKEEYERPEMKQLQGYLEKLDEYSSLSSKLQKLPQNFKSSFESRRKFEEIKLKSQNGELDFMSECNQINSYSILIAEMFIDKPLNLKTNHEKMMEGLKIAGYVFGGLFLAASAALGIAVAAIGIAAEAAFALTSAGIAVGSAGIASVASAAAINVFDDTLAQEYEQKLLFLIEKYGGKRPLVNDIAVLEEVLCKEIFGYYKDTEIPALNHVLARIDKRNYREDYCEESLNDIRLITKVFVTMKYIRALLRKFKFITVLGKKNSGKTTFLKRFFEHHGQHDIARNLKTGVDSEGATRFCSTYMVQSGYGKKLCVIDTPGIGDVSQMTGLVIDGTRASVFSNIFLQLDCLAIVTFGKSYELDTKFSLDILVRQRPRDYCIFGNQIDNCLEEIDKSYAGANMQEKLNAHKTSLVEKYNEKLREEYRDRTDVTPPRIMIEKFYFSSFLPQPGSLAASNGASAARQSGLYLNANDAVLKCIKSIID